LLDPASWLRTYGRARRRRQVPERVDDRRRTVPESGGVIRGEFDQFGEFRLCLSDRRDPGEGGAQGVDHGEEAEMVVA
jgi:hypothetical protein